MRYFGMTNIGMKRQVNQDSFLIKEYENGLLAVVCDGMGGASGGEEASSTAVAAFSGYTDIGFVPERFSESDDVGILVKDVFLSAARAANTAVYSASNDNDSLRGMGTTLVSAYIADGKVYAVNIGDSRMYIVKDNEITQITHDHSYVQYLVDIGKITADEAKTSGNKNIITRAVGTEESVEADFFTVDTEMEGGYVVLCTDGLTNHIKEDDIVRCVTESETPEIACAELIDQANLGGGSDNITVIVVSM